MNTIRTEANLVEGTIIRRRPQVDPDETAIAEVLIWEKDDVIEVEIRDYAPWKPTPTDGAWTRTRRL
jgi:hypothetical protein